MNGHDPTWLKVILAAVPVVVALLAGAFALVNTANKRAERIKALVETHKNLFPKLNVDAMVETMIVFELYELQLALDKLYRSSRIFMVFLIFGLIYFSALFSVSFTEIFNPTFNNIWRVLGPVGAAVSIGTFLYMIWWRRIRARTHSTDRDAALTALDKRHKDESGSGSG